MTSLLSNHRYRNATGPTWSSGNHDRGESVSTTVSAMDDQRLDPRASSSRRDFLRRATRVAGATALAPSLQGLVACATTPGGLGARGAPAPRRAGRGEGGYGPV